MTYTEPFLVIVYWSDSEADVTWESRDDATIEERHMIESIGFLIAKNKHSILLAADMSKASCHSGCDNGIESNRAMQIPLKCIDSIRRVCVVIDKLSFNNKDILQ